jgi:hypothetical protein
MSESILLLGHHYCCSNHSSAPSASYLNIRLDVVCWTQCSNYYYLIPSESLYRTLYMATKGGYFFPGCPCTLPNLTLCTFYLTFHFAWPSKFSLYNTCTICINPLPLNPFQMIEFIERQPVLECHQNIFNCYLPMLKSISKLI